MDEQDDKNEENNEAAKGSVNLEMKKDLEPDMIRDIFAEALKENKVDGKLPGMILEMLDTAMNSSKSKGNAVAPKGDNVIELPPKPQPQAATPRESSPFEKEVQANIRKAVSEYMSERAKDEKVQESKELNIDAAFLKEHGASLAGSVLGAFAKSIIPEDFKLDVTPGAGEGERADGEDPEQVSVKLDIGGMLQNLFDSTKKGEATADSEVDE
jgi:hypothetical protein